MPADQKTGAGAPIARTRQLLQSAEEDPALVLRSSVLAAIDAACEPVAPRRTSRLHRLVAAWPRAWPRRHWLHRGWLLPYAAASGGLGAAAVLLVLHGPQPPAELGPRAPVLDLTHAHLALADIPAAPPASAPAPAVEQQAAAPVPGTADEPAPGEPANAATLPAAGAPAPEAAPAPHRPPAHRRVVRAFHPARPVVAVRAIGQVQGDYLDKAGGVN